MMTQVFDKDLYCPLCGNDLVEMMTQVYDKDLYCPLCGNDLVEMKTQVFDKICIAIFVVRVGEFPCEAQPRTRLICYKF